MSKSVLGTWIVVLGFVGLYILLATPIEDVPLVKQSFTPVPTVAFDVIRSDRLDSGIYKFGTDIGIAGHGVEFIRAEESGKIYVRGELVDDNQAVYEAFKKWLEMAMGGELR